MPEEQVGQEPKPKKVLPFKGVFVVVLSVLIGAGVVYGLARAKPEFLGLPKGSAQIQAEVDLLLTELGKLIALPAGEKPTVATITDVDKLVDQTFFRNAQNGDKIVIYANARRAILYRPAEKKIIEVGAVNINQASPLPTVSAPATEAKETLRPSPIPTLGSNPAASPLVGE